MSNSPKEIFEIAATVGLGSRGFTPKVMAHVLRGVKETIDELRDSFSTLTPTPEVDNTSQINELSRQLKDLQSQVDALKKIKVTKKNEPVTKRKGTA